MKNIGKMIDLKRDPKKEPETAPAFEPAYPYGTCFSLGDEEIEKLGVDLKDIDTGDTLHLFAFAKVTSKTDREESGKRVELQITHLSVEDEDGENRAESRYGAKDGDD